MADFEDATSPTWANLIDGQANLMRRRAADHLATSPETGKHYALNAAARDADGAAARLSPAREALRRRRPAGARHALRLRLYLFHNAAALPRRGTGPYFYLPKMQSHLEARLWNEIFVHAQTALQHPARHHQGDRAHRDAAGGVRDGRDPLRAARSHRRASTAAGGTTSSARSRRCRTTRRSCCPIAVRSRWRRRSCAPTRSC